MRASHQFSAAEINLLSDLLGAVLNEQSARDLLRTDEFASLARKVQTMRRTVSRGTAKKATP